MAKRKPKSERPTVVQVIPTLEIGGAERGTVDVAAALVTAGWRALVISQGGRLVRELEAAGAEHIILPVASKNPLQMVVNARALRRFIEREHVDIIHARSRAPAWSAYFAARKSGIPFLTTYHGIYNESFPLKRLYNSVMAQGDVTIANSQYTAAVIRERHAGVISRVEVVHRGVDLEIFSARNVAASRVDKIRQDWQLDGTKKVLLLPARLSGLKGHGLLIEALATIDLSTLPPFVCVFAGDTGGREHMVTRLEQQSRTLGLAQDLIKFPGHCEDMAAAYLAANIVLMPSTVPETFGRVAAEAQAMGRPVIVTDSGAVGETVCAWPEFEEPDITGWRVASNDCEALAAAIVQALQIPDKTLERIGKSAVKFISQNYSVDKMTSATLDLYRELSKNQ
jgi:glycosyltransferase involved in cell wall biosynthesis